MTASAPTTSSTHKKSVHDLSERELKDLIAKSPKHQRIVRLYVPILVLAGVGVGLGCVWIGVSCKLGSAVVDEYRWLIFHFVAVQTLLCAHAGFAWTFRCDMENLEDTWQYKVDISRMLIAEMVAAFLLLYVYIKLQSVATLELYSQRCSHKLFRVLPGLLFVTFLVFLVIESWLCWILYHNPTLNPPKDELEQERRQGAAVSGGGGGDDEDLSDGAVWDKKREDSGSDREEDRLVNQSSSGIAGRPNF